MSISAIINTKEMTIQVDNTAAKTGYKKLNSSKQRRKSKHKISWISTKFDKSGKELDYV